MENRASAKPEVFFQHTLPLILLGNRTCMLFSHLINLALTGSLEGLSYFNHLLSCVSYRQLTNIAIKTVSHISTEK